MRTITLFLAALASCGTFGAEAIEADKGREAIVFVGAHPDDTEGFAATAFLLRDRYELHVVDLTRGELGLGWKGLEDGTTARTRTAEEEKACAFLGATPHFLSEVDGSACAGEKSVARLTELVAALRPRAVFTHWPIDRHADHVQAWSVVANALRRSGLTPEVYFFEVLRSQTEHFTPVYSVDVTRTIDDKARMLRLYACQNQDDELVREKLDQASARGRERRPQVAAAEIFTTESGEPIEGGVLESLGGLVVRVGKSVPLANGADFATDGVPENLVARLGNGESVSFLVGENATTGYEWAATYATNECEVAIEHRGPGTGRPICGAPGKAAIKVTRRASSAAPVAVEFAYRRSWEPDKPARRFLLVIDRDR